MQFHASFYLAVAARFEPPLGKGSGERKKKTFPFMGQWEECVCVRESEFGVGRVGQAQETTNSNK